MNLNAKKCASRSLRGSFEDSLNGTTLASAQNRRHFFVLMNTNLK